jgi:hypothetical protein
MGDRELYRETMDVALQMLPALEYALQGSGVFIEKDTENKVNQLCGKIAQKASPDLRQAIEKLRDDLQSGKLMRDLGIKNN